MQNHRTTGLSSTSFATLLKAFNNHLIWSKSDQKLRKIALNQALKMMLIYHRYNSTEKFLVDISASLNPHINLIEKALLEILKPMVKPLEKAPNVSGFLPVNGTLIPVWSWRSQGQTDFSGKHKRVGFNRQVICTLDGELVTMTDPVPGARHDVYAFRTTFSRDLLIRSWAGIVHW